MSNERARRECYSGESQMADYEKEKKKRICNLSKNVVENAPPIA